MGGQDLSRDEIHYAWSGDVAIAYSVSGSGPPDIIFAHGSAGNIEIERETLWQRAFLDRVASFSRFIIFDRRGTGLSDRPRAPATLEARMDDVRAVLDAVGSQRAVLFGTVEAASMCALFAATYPERTLGLVLHGPIARGTWAPDYPWASTAEEWRRQIEQTLATWGTYASAEASLRNAAPTHADDPEFVLAWGRHHRLSVSPGAAATLLRMQADVDVRDILPAIRVPTLVVDLPANRQEADYIASRIPGARRFEIPGPDFAIYLQVDSLLPEIERFVSTLDVGEPETVLATVLFTDIVGSTARQAEVGTVRWRELVDRHHSLVRRLISNFRGREVDTSGDGFFATFDGPMRAIRCAHAIVESVHTLGLQVRVGLHTGECQAGADKLTGLAVNIGARLAGMAGADEVLVSSTVKDLVVGSGLEFEERGEDVQLKGVPGRWRLFRALPETRR